MQPLGQRHDEEAVEAGERHRDQAAASPKQGYSQQLGAQPVGDEVAPTERYPQEDGVA